MDNESYDEIEREAVLGSKKRREFLGHSLKSTRFFKRGSRYGLASPSSSQSAVPFQDV